jgi:hypothetical protein
MHPASGRPAKMPHARAVRVADRQDCPEPHAPGDPHQQLATPPAVTGRLPARADQPDPYRHWRRCHSQAIHADNGGLARVLWARSCHLASDCRSVSSQGRSSIRYGPGWSYGLLAGGACRGSIRRRRRHVMPGPGQRLDTARAGIAGRWPGDGLAAGSPALAVGGRITPKRCRQDRDDSGDDSCLQLRRRHG